MARPLPRRQAWSSAAEFNQVFDLLFSSNGDASSQRAAVDRLQAWQVRSPSSFAPSLAATASFVTLLLAPSSAAADAATGDASTQRRLALSMAITRFVNGLVDPLQQGYYARSIAQIAEELGLPSWFVDVRHRATHEDLPGEEVLRHAATQVGRFPCCSKASSAESMQQALDWLYARYWLPTLHSLSSSASSRSMQQAAHVDALASLLQQYKTLQKALLVDSTAAQPQDIDAILQEIVAWVVKAGFEAAAAGGVRLVSSDSRDGSADAEDEAESAGIAMLVERLAEVEVLVPRSRKCASASCGTDAGPSSSIRRKRTTVQAPAPLPRALTALYEPLLNHLASAYPTTFASTLIVHLLATVLSAPDALKRSQAPSTDRDDEATFFATLAGWFAWCLVDSKVLRLDVERKRQETKQLLLSPNP